jgi:predicted PurR-regulated permease PerM
MTTSDSSSHDKLFLSRALEATIRIGLILLLAAWCFQIVQPFIIPVVWGIIIATATYPAYRWLEGALGGRRGIAATLFTLLMMVILITPTLKLAETLVNGSSLLSGYLEGESLRIPPPPESIANWPIIGEPLAGFWSLASENLGAALQQIAPQLKAFGGWLLKAAAGAGLGILMFVVAIIIAGALLAHAQGGHRAAYAIATRLAGDRGADFADLAEATVRSVAQGILGVALIQSLLAGIGFLAVGLPGAGLWALLCLLLAVVQIGIGLVVVPIVIYVFYTADTLTAVLFLIWCTPLTVLDNILKPLLLGRGVNVPMVVIFVGAIGGFLTSGIIGLFVGSVILALGYTLFVAWLAEDPQLGLPNNNAESSSPKEVTSEKE